jgi:hypothetical protein
MRDGANAMKSKVEQHEIAVEMDGQRFVGRYTVEVAGCRARLTVWFQGRSKVDPEIAPEAEPTSTEQVALGLLRQLVEEGQ